MAFMSLCKFQGDPESPAAKGCWRLFLLVGILRADTKASFPAVPQNHTPWTLQQHSWDHLSQLGCWEMGWKIQHDYISEYLKDQILPDDPGCWLYPIWGLAECLAAVRGPLDVDTAQALLGWLAFLPITIFVLFQQAFTLFFFKTSVSMLSGWVASELVTWL